ncbi:uncharacterized protein V3H82_012372 [Fundulus diaphanus]
MRRKNRAKGASQGAVEKKAFTCSKTKGSAPLGGMKQQDNLSKNPAGRGLGKAGAKRLGRLLKRVIVPQEEPAGKAKASVPNHQLGGSSPSFPGVGFCVKWRSSSITELKHLSIDLGFCEQDNRTASVTCQPSRVSETPVRLFKHQIETKANKAPKAEPSKQQVSQLILSVVSQCKNRGGISMAELKQTLADQGYDVAKNNRQVKVVTERLVKDETLERTTRNTSFRLSNKKVMEVKAVKTSTATSPEPTREVRAASKSPEGAAESQKKEKKMPKARGRTQKLKANTSRAAGKAQKKRRQATKPRGNSPKPTRKKPQLAKSRTTQGKKPPAKARSTQRNQPKQVTSSRRKQPQRGRLPKTSSRVQTQRRRKTRTRKR